MRSYCVVFLFLLWTDFGSIASIGTEHPCLGNSLECIGNVLCEKIIGAQNKPFPQPKDLSLILEYPQYNLYERKFNIVFYNLDKIVAKDLICDHKNNITKLTLKYPELRVDGDVWIKIVLNDDRTVVINDTYIDYFYKPLVTIKWDGTANIDKNKNVTDVELDILLETIDAHWWETLLTDPEFAAYYGVHLTDLYGLERDSGIRQTKLATAYFIDSIICPK